MRVTYLTHSLSISEPVYFFFASCQRCQVFLIQYLEFEPFFFFFWHFKLCLHSRQVCLISPTPPTHPIFHFETIHYLVFADASYPVQWLLLNLESCFASSTYTYNFCHSWVITSAETIYFTSLFPRSIPYVLPPTRKLIYVLAPIQNHQPCLHPLREFNLFQLLCFSIHELLIFTSSPSSTAFYIPTHIISSRPF